ncbi:glycoprotein-N-acetylgalactosamine 3-beta-galactosyltransferase 1-like [Tropilaelaps mercedesae]|uniref:Glycoprotein-N-acetylgalactosamine 3-beta-galactosyltransferase 1 n=1 Tax=Tropilaelaps mercedesae TaxID=418985 RepID=A0A1V9XTB3_9ACAR|nr:glycoprotein-N-acetylgalactosamine 3-beta-galactosyltransferase 1-like [Tropilaelaps mercedesae]
MTVGSSLSKSSSMVKQSSAVVTSEELAMNSSHPNTQTSAYQPLTSKMIQMKDVAYTRRRYLHSSLPLFIAGILIGFSLALLVISAMKKPQQPITYGRFLQLQRMMLRNQKGPHRTKDEDDDIADESVKPKHFHDHGDNYSDDLSNKVRVLCWVMTSPKSHQSKAVHVQMTWGKRCNILLFMSSKEDANLTNLVALPMDAEDRNHLWQKTKLAFHHVYDHYRDQADWFLKADDDTYVIVENLRHFLSRQNSTKPIYFGHKFKTLVEQGYMSGGAGYVLSRESLDRFAERGAQICRQDAGGSEDVNMGDCMMKLGVEAGNSRDKYGSERFLPLTAGDHITDRLPDWFFAYTAYRQNGGEKTISDSVISFHYTDAIMMHLLDFMLYHVRPYGLYPWYEKEDIGDEPNRASDVTSH